MAKDSDQVDTNNVAQDNKHRSELNGMSSRLHEAHGELGGKLTALAAVVSGMGGRSSAGPPVQASLQEIFEKLRVTSGRLDTVAPGVDQAHKNICQTTTSRGASSTQ